MSSLVLLEVRIPRATEEGRSLPDVTLTAEWFKAAAGMRQYRAVSHAGMYSQPGTRYFDTAQEAVNAVLSMARRVYRKQWENRE